MTEEIGRKVLHIFDGGNLSTYAMIAYIVMATRMKGNMCLEPLSELVRRTRLNKKKVLSAIHELTSQRMIIKQTKGRYSFPYLRDGE